MFAAVTTRSVPLILSRRPLQVERAGRPRPVARARRSDRRSRRPCGGRCSPRCSHGDGRGRRVDAALRLGLRHPLHTVDPGLELELRVRAATADLEDDLLEAALLGVALRQDLGPPAMPLGVARVHTVEVAREESRLFPTLARANLDDHVLLIEGVARDELGAKLAADRCDVVGRLGELLTREVAQIDVVAFGELARLGGPALGAPELAHRVHDRLERGELLSDGPQARRIRRRRRIGEQAPELVISLFDLLESLAQAGREHVGHAAASVSRSPAIASSSEATATSIIRASGRRVVIRCSSRPGATIARMSGERSWAAPKRSTSYEIEATGTTRTSRTIRSNATLTRGRNAKRTIATKTTNRRKAVPQRGCAVGYGSIRSGTSGSPCSNAWIVMCSAPW